MIPYQSCPHLLEMGGPEGVSTLVPGAHTEQYEEEPGKAKTNLRPKGWVALASNPSVEQVYGKQGTAVPKFKSPWTSDRACLRAP